MFWLVHLLKCYSFILCSFYRKYLIINNKMLTPITTLQQQSFRDQCNHYRLHTDCVNISTLYIYYYEKRYKYQKYTQV